MKNFLTTIQKNMMAATFAEAGEWDTAREMIPDVEPVRELNWLNRIFMAVAFAESGLQGEAVRFLKPAAKNRTFDGAVLEELGLGGVHLMYGTVSI